MVASNSVLLEIMSASGIVKQHVRFIPSVIKLYNETYLPFLL